MTCQITKKMLEKKVDYLNQLTGNPTVPWTKNKDGKFKANIGNYHLSGAYGGYSLERMCTDGGGVTTPLNTGCVPKRELFNAICHYINGIESGKSL